MKTSRKTIITMVSAAPKGQLSAPELLLDQVADHDLVRPAEQLSADEVADRRQEHEHRAGEHALARVGQRDVAERLPAGSVEVLARLDQRRVHAVSARRWAGS